MNLPGYKTWLEIINYFARRRDNFSVRHDLAIGTMTLTGDKTWSG